MGDDDDQKDTPAAQTDGSPEPSEQRALTRTDGAERASPLPPVKSPSARPGTPLVFDSQSQALFQQILHNQKEEFRLKGDELRVRSEELKYRNEELERNYQISLKAIDGQERVQNGQLQHVAHVTTMRYRFMLLGGVVIAGVIVCAMLSGNKDFALEAIKLAATFGGGTGAGYAFGRRARNRRPSIEEQDEEVPDSDQQR